MFFLVFAEGTARKKLKLKRVSESWRRTNLCERRAQLLKVLGKVCFRRQVFYSQEGGQRLDQIPRQVDVVGLQSDLR